MLAFLSAVLEESAGGLNGRAFTMKTRIVALALALATPAVASSIPFDFTITDIHGGGVVTGVVVLSDQSGPQFSDDVRVVSNTAGWGIGEYFTFFSNVGQGRFVSVDRFFYGLGHPSGVFDAYLDGVELDINTSGEHPFGALINANGFCICGPTMLVLDPVPAPGPVVGAGLPGLLAGFAGLVAWWRRRGQVTPPSRPARQG
jgi:hypothetical protein